MAELEARLAALEEREDAGVWEETQNYRRFSGVTHDGSSWIAQRDRYVETEAWRFDRVAFGRATRQAGEGGPAGKDGKDLR